MRCSSPDPCPSTRACATLTRVTASGVAADAPGGLARRIGLPGAVGIGLSAMLGAGVFVVWQPAALAAGWWSLGGLAIAAFIATMNALTMARLAAGRPRSGGVYLYAGEIVGANWGFAAGWLFLAGKTASAGAMALVVGTYVWPEGARPIALAVVVVATILNLRGVRMTAWVGMIIALVTITGLGIVVALALIGGPVVVDVPVGVETGGALNMLTAAGILFYAFAGYARLATLGEEVRDPERTIPRAILIALVVALVVYAAVGVTVMLTLGPAGTAVSPVPLATVLGGSGGEILVRILAALAGAGALLGVLAGLSRTSLAMARGGDLPGPLAVVSPRTGSPAVAELTVGAVVFISVMILDPSDLVGFSACAVLLYYAIAHVSALRLPVAERRGPRWIPVVGLVGCVALGLALPWASLTATAAVLAVCLIVRAFLRP